MAIFTQQKVIAFALGAPSLPAVANAMQRAAGGNENFDLHAVISRQNALLAWSHLLPGFLAHEVGNTEPIPLSMKLSGRHSTHVAFAPARSAHRHHQVIHFVRDCAKMKIIFVCGGLVSSLNFFPGEVRCFHDPKFAHFS